MTDSLIPKRKRRLVLDLQLTAMIDIFSLIVIFLIKGTVFGVSDLPVDRSIKLPQSRSKESLDTAPFVQIMGDRVMFSGSGSSESSTGLLVSELLTENSKRDVLMQDLRAYLSKLPTEARGSGVLLSVIADREAPYEKVFEVVRFFRGAGFDSLLFVAAAEGDR